MSTFTLSIYYPIQIDFLKYSPPVRPNLVISVLYNIIWYTYADCLVYLDVAMGGVPPWNCKFQRRIKGVIYLETQRPSTCNLHIIRWTWITIKIVRQDYNSPKLHKTIADYTGYPHPHRLNFSITCSSAPRQLVQQ